MQKRLSSLLTPQAPKILCPKHPNQIIHSLCFESNCSSPCICAYCESDHSSDHSQVLQSINRIYSHKTFAKYVNILNSDFSSQNIEYVKDQTFMVIRGIEDEFRKTIQAMITTAEAGFDRLLREVASRKSRLEGFEEIKGAFEKDCNNMYLKELIKSYKLIKKESSESLDVNLKALSSIIKREAAEAMKKTQNELLLSLKRNMGLGTLDFSQLKVQEKFEIPWSTRLEPGAITYISKWNAIAFGCKDDSNYSIGLYNLETKRIISSIRSIHQGSIINVIWVDHKDYLLTGSFSTIKVSRVYNEGKTMQVIHTLRGFKGQVRCLKYIESENLLVSAGSEANIKLWRLENLKRCGGISTNSQGNIVGTIAYIDADRLIGVAFEVGFIHFYQMQNRSLMFRLNVSPFNTINPHGFQYLRRKKMIITNTTGRHIRAWYYVEGEKRVSQEIQIETKNTPYCVVASRDESQILYIVMSSQKQQLEMYNFDTYKTQCFDLPNEIRGSNGLIALETGGMLTGDFKSGNMCILK